MSGIHSAGATGVKIWENVLLLSHSDTEVLNISNAPSTLLVLTQLELVTTQLWILLFSPILRMRKHYHRETSNLVKVASKWYRQNFSQFGRWVCSLNCNVLTYWILTIGQILGALNSLLIKSHTPQSNPTDPWKSWVLSISV